MRSATIVSVGQRKKRKLMEVLVGHDFFFGSVVRAVVRVRPIFAILVTQAVD